MASCYRAEILSLLLPMCLAVPPIIPSPLFGRFPQRGLPAEPEPPSAPSAAWWAQRKTLRQTPPEDATHCAVCTGGVRHLGWSWLAGSRHFFGIYLPETLQCKPLVHAVVQRPTVDRTWALRHDQSKHWFWGGLLFALDLFRGQRGTHIFYFPGSGWWCQRLPNLLLLQLVDFAFVIHLSFRSTESCRWQSEEWDFVLETSKVLNSWCYIGIWTFFTIPQAEKPAGLLWAYRFWMKI